MFQGVSDTLFAPDKTMTRAMVVTVLWRNAGSPKGGEAEFVDVEPGQWYTEAVAWAAENSIVNGVGEGRFAPMLPSSIAMKAEKKETAIAKWENC